MTWHLIRCDELPSTSDHLKTLAEAGAPAGTVVVAKRQPQGHGRRGRVWLAPPDALLMSVLLRPDQALPLLSLGVGVAVCEALAMPALHLKWPNDLLCGSDKCGGILVEGRWSGDRPDWYVIGLGLNVAAAPMLSGTSCLAAHGGPQDPERVLAAVLAALARWMTPAALQPERVLPAWRASSRLWGTSITVYPTGGDPWPGVIEDIDQDGALLVRSAGGEVRALQSGEISLTAPDARRPLG